MNANLRVQKSGKGLLLVTGKCGFCKNELKIENVSEDGYNDWKRGELIQDTLPTITIDDATILNLGVCATCVESVPGGGLVEDVCRV